MTNNPNIADTHPIIEVQALIKAFGLMPVLRGINLDIPRGQCVALLGPNGSGKSTLLRLLTGLSKPTSGMVKIGGWELPHEGMAVRAQIGMVSHKPLLYGDLTAYENLRFFAGLYDLDGEAMDTRIHSLLDQVGLKKRRNDLARNFSRGMQQRLSIARALLHDPDVLIFDEPYTGLDQQAGATLDTLLTTARDGGRTIVMATHQLDRAARLSDRAIILSRGKIAYDGITAGLAPSQLARDYAEVTGEVVAR